LSTGPPITQQAVPNRIRVETALSRFPIHCLSKKGAVTIDLQRINEAGEADFKWEVTYNSKHGQPGPLAYKVDTLVVNRLLDQLGRPLPELVRIGSLSEVCRSLGTQDTGPNIANLKSAFLQNASAFINAKIRYKTKAGREKWTEIGYTRYSVVFTGEALPDGTQADAVHIVLNPPYRELLNHVETRPLDYDYLKKLPPGPQRFYELLSFQIYGAIAGTRPRAKLLYSDYCKYAPQVRYADFDHVKKQMYKLHAPHRQSGYIAKVEFEPTADQEGKPDWAMFYTPGPKAFTEYRAFTSRLARHPALNPLQAPCPVEPPRKSEPAQLMLDGSVTNDPVVAELTMRGVTEKKARALLTKLQLGQVVQNQIQYVDKLIANSPRGKFRNPAGMYVRFIEDNMPVPEAMGLRQEGRPRQAEYEEHCRQEVERFVSVSMSRSEYRLKLQEHSTRLESEFPSMPAGQIKLLAHAAVCAEVRENGNIKLPTWEQFQNRPRT
jgi:hypothetical protein